MFDYEKMIIEIEWGHAYGMSGQKSTATKI